MAEISGSVVTKDALLSALSALTNVDGDTEWQHSEADRLLLAYINDQDVRMAYEVLPKWYA